MYKSRIRAWGLEKNNKSGEVEEILRQTSRRRALGKRSQFVLRGRTVDMADIERYAKRKGLRLNEASTGLSDCHPELICLTPPASPSPGSINVTAPAPLQNVERFLHLFDNFVKDHLHAGTWTIGEHVMGFTSILGPEYPKSARDEFFLSIERGVRRYDWDDFTQAYRQWRAAFSRLPSVINAKNPAQLFCLVELLARLAECKEEVAALLLTFMGELVKREPNTADSRIKMLESLSKLETATLRALVGPSQECSRRAFRARFQTGSFFLLDSETILTESEGSTVPANVVDEHGSVRLEKLASAFQNYDHKALRAARSVLEILLASLRFEDAERVALAHLQNMQQMPYDGVVAGAFSHAHGHLAHLYLLRQDYTNAYEHLQAKVHNYFRMLTVRSDLPDDFILVTYAQLVSAARILGKNEEAETWQTLYSDLKLQVDDVARVEIETLQKVAGPMPTDTISVKSTEHCPTSVKATMEATPAPFSYNGNRLDGHKWSNTGLGGGGEGGHCAWAAGTWRDTVIDWRQSRACGSLRHLRARESIFPEGRSNVGVGSPFEGIQFEADTWETSDQDQLSIPRSCQLERILPGSSCR
jgi:hypothetical protein